MLDGSTHAALRLATTTLGAGLLALAGCSSSSAGAAPVADAGDAASTPDATDASDAMAAADVPEPPWGGTTVEPDCKVNGCVRAFTANGSYAKELLAPFAAADAHVDNGIAIYLIKYWSDGDEITGSVYVPDSPAPAGGFPVVVMNQFTSGVGAPCAPSAGQLGIGTASSTALRGILTIVPDATSYGPDKLGVYLAGPPAGRAALDAARAAFHLGQALGQPVARRAVIAGLSQGGHSTMATAAQLPTYAPQLEIRGFAAVAPPANFRLGANAIFSSGKGFGVYVAMRMYTWQRYYALGGAPLFKEPYASQADAWFSNECVFNGVDGSSGTLAAHWPADPALVMTDTYLAMGKTDSWTPGWRAAYDASQPIPTGVTQPIAIFQGTADTTVPQADTDAYVGQLKAAGVTVDYHLVAGADHGSTALSSFTVAQPGNEDAVTWIRARLAP
jgi:acetyl esterase/lipase